MLVTELGNENDWVKTSVFGKGVGDELKGLTVSAAAVGVSTENNTGVLDELVGDFHLNAGATGEEGSFLDEGTDDTEGVMEGSLGFLEHEYVGTAEEN
jgi:hypothetical protein